MKNKNQKLTQELFREVYTVLFQKSDDITKIDKLIKDGADVNACIITTNKINNQKLIAPILFAAVECDRLDLVKLFSSNGVDVNKNDSNGRSILHVAYAAANRDPKPKGQEYHNTKAIFEEILKKPELKIIDPNLVGNVIANKDKDYLKFLLNSGKLDLIQKDKNGLNPIDMVYRYIIREMQDKHFNSESKLIEIFELLKSKGAVESEESSSFLGEKSFVPELIDRMNDQKKEVAKQSSEDKNDFSKTDSALSNALEKIKLSGESLSHSDDSNTES